MTGNDPFSFHTYEIGGTYTVTLTTVSADGCVSEFSVTLTIGGDEDGFTGGPTFSLVSGTDDLLDESVISISPNPTNGETVVNWQSTEATQYTWMLYDISGRLLQTNNGDSEKQLEQIRLDLSKLQSGIYLFRLQTPQGARTLRISKI